jgi:hypothetical protein
MSFGGTTFDPARDEARLNEQCIRVYRLMKDSEWRTLYEISAVTADPVQSISARLRDLRKPKFGGFEVERQRRSGGTWEYRLMPSTGTLTLPSGKASRYAFEQGVLWLAKRLAKTTLSADSKKELVDALTSVRGGRLSTPSAGS